MAEKTDRETPDGLPVITGDTNNSLTRDLKVRFVGKPDETYVSEVMERIERDNPKLISFFAQFWTESMIEECEEAGHLTALTAFVLTYELFRRQAEADKYRS